MPDLVLNVQKNTRIRLHLAQLKFQVRAGHVVRYVFVLRYSVLMPYYTSRLLQVISELGNLEGGSFTRHFERWMNGTVKVERLSLSL
jgi:hypothetical protein